MYDRINGFLKFPVGTKVRPLGDQTRDMKSFRRTFYDCESRPYMIVTGHSDDGWLKFDNKEYTLRGGSWNPNRFQIYDSIEVELPEDMFTI